MSDQNGPEFQFDKANYAHNQQQPVFVAPPPFPGQPQPSTQRPGWALDSQAVPGYAGDYAAHPAEGSFARALLLGVPAALLGSVVWALVAQAHLIVGFVAIGLGWLVARAMMTATGGRGGRSYQIAAVLLTYLGCTSGDVLGEMILAWRLHATTPTLSWWIAPALVAGPVFELFASPAYGAIGLFIIFIGLRTAWRMAAGTPGFGSGRPGAGITPFGLR